MGFGYNEIIDIADLGQSFNVLTEKEEDCGAAKSVAVTVARRGANTENVDVFRRDTFSQN